MNKLFSIECCSKTWYVIAVDMIVALTKWENSLSSPSSLLRIEDVRDATVRISLFSKHDMVIP